MTWWRRNRIALIAVVALAPIGVGVVAGLPVLDDLTYFPPPVRTIPVGETAETHGLTFSVDTSLDARTDVAHNMSLVGVLVTLDPGDIDLADTDLICSATLTDDGPGGSGEREWQTADDPESLGWAYLDDTARACYLSEITGETQLELVFYVPPGTYEQATLEIAVSVFDLDDIGDGGGLKPTVIEPPLRFALDYDAPTG